MGTDLWKEGSYARFFKVMPLGMDRKDSG